MTDREQNMVNRLKMLAARIIIDLDDEKVLKIIKTAAREKDNDEERPHGEWEPIVENGTPYWEENYEPMFLCTRCKCKSYKKPFCPNCGADNREGDT